ncbi:MAG: ABC transporter transmembrane domain-containing protein, partial [Verrucomicrobiota bacterium]
MSALPSQDAPERARDAASQPTAAPRRGSLRDVRAILAYMRPWRLRVALAIVALLVSMTFGLMFPILLGDLLDAAIPSFKTAPPTGWRSNINQVALVLMSTLVIQALLTWFYSYTFNWVGEKAIVEVRRNLYSRLISMPMSFFGEHRVGELSSRLSNDVGQLQDMLTAVVPQTLRQCILLFGGITVIAVTSLKLSLVM